MKFLLASLKPLTNSKKLFRKTHQISVQGFLCSHWLIFSSVQSQPAFGTIFKGTGDFSFEFPCGEQSVCTRFALLLGFYKSQNSNKRIATRCSTNICIPTLFL
jgi:hypothetical protein